MARGYIDYEILNEHRPDEKGIATISLSHIRLLPSNEHRPDEKGIATLIPKNFQFFSSERTQT